MTYVYKVPEAQLAELNLIKNVTNEPISKHIRSAIDIYIKRYKPGGDLYEIHIRRDKEQTGS